MKDLKALLQSDIFELVPSQNKLCYPIIQWISRKMMIGIQFENINVDRQLLINGHHRYVCSLLLNKAIVRNPWTGTSIVSDFKWSTIEIDDLDWESGEIIDRHNHADAIRACLGISDLEILLSNLNSCV